MIFQGMKEDAKKWSNVVIEITVLVGREEVYEFILKWLKSEEIRQIQALFLDDW